MTKTAIAIALGVAAGIIARVVLVVTTGPRSVVVGFLDDWWEIPVSFLIGAVGFALSLYTIRRTSLLGSTASVLTLAISLVLHWAVFNIRVADQLLPGLWVK